MQKFKFLVFLLALCVSFQSHAQEIIDADNDDLNFPNIEFPGGEKLYGKVKTITTWKAKVNDDGEEMEKTLDSKEYYTEEGLLTLREEFRGDTSRKISYSTKYDTKNRIIEKGIKSIITGFWKKTTYTYKGDKIFVSSMRSDCKDSEYSIYQLNEKGDPFKTFVVFEGDTTLVREHIYQYDDKDRLIYDEYRSCHKKIVGKFEYNKQGELFKRNYDWYKTEAEFHMAPIVLGKKREKYTVKAPDSCDLEEKAATFTFNYDSDGTEYKYYKSKILNINKTFVEGGVSKVKGRSTFNAGGNKTQYIAYDLGQPFYTNEYEYKYDQNKNWVSKKNLGHYANNKNKTLVEAIYREISYY